MNEYMNNFEKQEIAQEFSRKRKRITLWRYGIGIAAIFLYIDMRHTRYLPSGIALGILMGLAVGMIVITTMRMPLDFCPFCGGGLGYKARKWGNIPQTCPKCGEKLKY